MPYRPTLEIWLSWEIAGSRDNTQLIGNDAHQQNNRHHHNNNNNCSSSNNTTTITTTTRPSLCSSRFCTLRNVQTRTSQPSQWPRSCHIFTNISDLVPAAFRKFRLEKPTFYLTPFQPLSECLDQTSQPFQSLRSYHTQNVQIRYADFSSDLRSYCTRIEQTRQSNVCSDHVPATLGS